MTPNIRCNLDKLIKENGIKQSWLAEKVGATKQQMNAWVKNRSLPSIGYILIIIKVTGWKLEDIFEEVEE